MLLLAAKGDIAADAVDRLVAPDIDQPRTRDGRQPALRPTLQRHRKGVLQYIFRQIEIADEADQRGHRPARPVAKDLFDFDRGHAERTLTLVILRCASAHRGAPQGAGYGAQLRTIARRWAASPERQSLLRHPPRPHLDRPQPRTPHKPRSAEPRSSPAARWESARRWRSPHQDPWPRPYSTRRVAPGFRRTGRRWSASCRRGPARWSPSWSAAAGRPPCSCRSG